MNIENLFHKIAYTTTLPPQTPLTGVTADSRKVAPGCLFVCITGMVSDGHDFAKQALERGASAVLVEQDLGLSAQILVSDTRKAYAQVCANWFGRPAEQLRLIGITGTNGKTSVCFILKHLLEKQGCKVGLIGTIQIMVGDEVFENNFTTPDAYEFHAYLSLMREKGCDTVVMEVSSHSLSLDRVYGVHFAVAGFTNLSQDHLDFHKDMESYFTAKKMLFEMADVGVTNADDEYGRRILDGKSCEKVSYAVYEQSAGYLAKNIRNRPDGIDFELLAPDSIGRVNLPIPGEFSVYNALCAAACAAVAGVPFPVIAEGLSTVSGVKGRLEVVPTGRDFTVIIDYAHTPDGVEKAIQAMRPTCEGRLVTLVGCGGDRDRKKRPIMGATAAKLSDFVIVTSDNPRTEAPAAIIADILEGLRGTKTPYVVIENREEAIQYAILSARPKDVLLLVGKGHETYQILGKEKIHFDEREKIAGALALREEQDKQRIMPVSLKDAARAMGVQTSAAVQCSSVSTDSRIVGEGALFFALHGDRFDGHAYVDAAFQKGAAAAVVDRPMPEAKGPVIEVADTRLALLQLAGWYRARFKIPVVGLTGSVGKTTTKEMIACVLSEEFKTLKTEGNLNNEIGLPRMLFRLNADYECAVLEMGMNHFGEISRLSKAARPTLGIITNIGVSHIEMLGSQEGILKAKREILDGMDADAPLLLNGDDKLLYEAAGQETHQVYLYGIDNPECACRARDIRTEGAGTSFVIEYKGSAYATELPTVGRHNIYNALCAFLTGVLLGIPPEKAAGSLRRYEPAGMRQRIVPFQGLTVIEDCYNASPDSVRAALSVLSALPVTGKRIAVLGDMLELGSYAPQAHTACGDAAAEAGVDLLLGYGTDARYCVEAAARKGVEALCFDDKGALSQALITRLSPGDAVLFKGSRAMKLEEVLNTLYEQWKAE